MGDMHSEDATRTAPNPQSNDGRSLLSKLAFFRCVVECDGRMALARLGGVVEGRGPLDPRTAGFGRSAAGHARHRLRQRDVGRRTGGTLCCTPRRGVGERHPTWTSGLGWRPLPRREYTQRGDYNAISAVNRHALTPGGWAHEQFNTKVLRKPDGTQVELAREFGFNDYQKTTDVDFKPAYRYWDATRRYWATVRAQWARFLDQSSGLHLKTKIDGMAMIMPLFEQAGRVEKGECVDDGEIAKVFAKWVEPLAADKRAADR